MELILPSECPALGQVARPSTHSCYLAQLRGRVWPPARPGRPRRHWQLDSDADTSLRLNGKHFLKGGSAWCISISTTLELEEFRQESSPVIRNRNIWWVALCGCLQLTNIGIDKSISKAGFSHKTWLLSRVDFGGG